MPNKAVNTLHAQVCTFVHSAGVAIVDERLFEQRVEFIDNEVMYYTVTKIGGKYFTLNRFVDDKAIDFPDS